MPLSIPHIFVGCPVEALPTPCLTLDLPKLKANLARMQALASQAGKDLRAHAKTHKCTRLAQLQVEMGAIGICAAKLAEAEGLSRAGIRNVLITGPVATPEAHARLAKLAEEDTTLLITLDDFENARTLSGLFAAKGLRIRCLLDLDVGQQRTGVSPQYAPGFAAALSTLPGLQLVGIQAYAGHAQHFESLVERRTENRRCLTIASSLYRELAPLFGLTILSATGTGSSDFDIEFPELTELQSGSYAVMDADYLAIEQSSPPYEMAATLQSSVVSAQQSTFVTIDAGLKSLYRDGATPRVLSPLSTHPQSSAEQMSPSVAFLYDWFGDEYGRLSLPPEMDCNEAAERIKASLPLGQRVELSLSHCDPTINLFDTFFIIEDGVVVDTWPIDLRGASQ